MGGFQPNTAEKGGRRGEGPAGAGTHGPEAQAGSYGCSRSRRRTTCRIFGRWFFFWIGCSRSCRPVLRGRGYLHRRVPPPAGPPFRRCLVENHPWARGLPKRGALIFLPERKNGV